MTYPGLVLLVGVGIGIATFLYYMFAENNHENVQEEQLSQGYNFRWDRRLSDHDDWRISSHQSENTMLNRRSSSNSSKKKAEEDINNCSICQYALIGLDVTQLQPCKHNFHKDCINKLRTHDPMAPCPNCRRTIRHAL